MYSIWYWDESLGFESHGNLSRSTLLWVWLIQNLTQLLSVFLVSTIVELWDSEAFELIDLFVFSFRRRPLLRLTLHSILPNLFSHPPSPSCDELGVGTWYLLRRGSCKLRKASIPMARAGGLKMPSHSNSTYIPYRTLTTYGTYWR